MSICPCRHDHGTYLAQKVMTLGCSSGTMRRLYTDQTMSGPPKRTLLRARKCSTVAFFRHIWHVDNTITASLLLLKHPRCTPGTTGMGGSRLISGCHEEISCDTLSSPLPLNPKAKRMTWRLVGLYEYGYREVPITLWFGTLYLIVTLTL